MRKSFSNFCTRSVLPVVFILLMSVSCTKDPGDRGNGCLKIRFPSDMYKVALETVDLPDTNDFILDIIGSDGKPIYSGYYGDSPEYLTVPSGNYTVKVRSFDFDRPQFSRPQFGDEQCIVVPSEGVVNVDLKCRQINSGIRLKISPDFLEVFPEGVLFVSSDDGRLMYGYSEKRIAYFNPGPVSVILDDGTDQETLLTRVLESQEILTIGIQVSDDMIHEEGDISISVDTTRVWNEEDFTIGGEEDKGGEMEDALSVSQAKDNIGEKDVWVCGYIVGGDLSKTSVNIIKIIYKSVRAFAYEEQFTVSVINVLF